jgi:hypothetical protein
MDSDYVEHRAFLLDWLLYDISESRLNLFNAVLIKKIKEELERSSQSI